MSGASGAPEPPWAVAWRDWVAGFGGAAATPDDAARARVAGGFASAYLEFGRALERMLAGAAPGEFTAQLVAALRGGASDQALNGFLRAVPAALLRNMPGGHGEQTWDQSAATFRRWTEQLLALPLLGPAREWQALLQRLEQAALAEQGAREAIARHYRAALRHGLERLASRLEQDDGPPITSLRELYDLWIDCAEAAYAERVMGEGFAVDFAAWVNAGSDLRLAVNAFLARAADAVDAPRREEIDALLARQRALEAELATLKAAQAAVATARATDPAPAATARPAAREVRPKPAPRARAGRATATARPGEAQRAPRKPAKPATSRPEFDIAEILRGK